EAERVIAKLSYGTDARFPVEHIGSTSVPGLPAKDVLDLQLLVPGLAAAEGLAPVLADLGYPGRRLADHLGEDGTEEKWFHGTPGARSISTCASRTPPPHASPGPSGTCCAATTVRGSNTSSSNANSSHGRTGRPRDTIRT